MSTGVLHSEASQHQRAVYFYQMAVHFNPNNSRALNNLGIVYKNIDNLEKSVECFMQCLNINDPGVAASHIQGCAHVSPSQILMCTGYMAGE